MNNTTPVRTAGVAMVEFAIILPLLLLLLFGVTELGRALYQQNTLYKAVEAGARYLARTSGTLNSSSCAIEDSDDWDDALDDAMNIIAFGNPAGTGTPLLPYLDDTAERTIDIVNQTTRTLTKTDGTVVPVCVISVEASVPFAGFFGEIAVPNLFGDSISSFSLRAETEERYIGR